MVFAANQEQNYSYTFKNMLLQPDKSCFILYMIKEVEPHEEIRHWTLMKNSKVKNKHKNKYGNLKNIFINLVFQAQEIPRWKINETQEQTLLTWRNVTMGS